MDTHWQNTITALAVPAFTSLLALGSASCDPLG